jgi:hypothetical protein
MRSSHKRSFSLPMAAGFVTTVWLLAESAAELDHTQHRVIPFFEKVRSVKETVRQFGRV